MGGGDVKVPPPTAEERALQRQQAELLRLQQEIITQQREQTAVVLPFLLEQEGFEVETDDVGNITSIASIPDPLEERRRGVEEQFLGRLEKALAGDLPVDPALEEALGQQEQTLRERLARQFGPGFETASPAIETLDEFFQSAEGLRHGARTGELSLSEQLLLSREQQRMLEDQSVVDKLFQFGVQNPMNFAGGFGQTARGAGQAQIPFIQHRQMQTNAAIANQQSRNQMLGGIGQMVGSIAGLAFMSDENIKEISDLIGYTDEGIPIYIYKRHDSDVEHIGVMAQDVAQVRPDAVGERGGYLTVDYERLTDG